jgi:kynurenine formamidase
MTRWKTRPEGSNWGDFGDDDQSGKMNLLTDERRLAAVREVRDGKAFTLSLPLDYPGGNVVAAGRNPPRIEPVRLANGDAKYNFAVRCVCDRFTDVICDDLVHLHTQYSTQWDSLAHVGSEFDADADGIAEKVFYNGYRAETDIGVHDGVARAGALGIENLAVGGAQGRGVLVDLHRIYGRGAAAVGYDALMRALDEQKIEVRIGDFLCLYTSYADVLLEQNRNPDPKLLHKTGAALDGSDAKLLRWITDSGLVAICSDNPAVETVSYKPRGTALHAMLPLHEHCLFKQGIHLGELWYLTELATWLRSHERHAFLLTAPPLRLPGSTGSPVTPLATV